MNQPVRFVHDVRTMLLDESDQGEIILPSEVKLINFTGTIRQFTILSRRLCSVEAINSFSQREVMNTRHLSYIPPGLIAIKNSIPFIGLNLKFKPSDPKVELKSFIENHGEKFFDFLIQIIGYSNIKNHQGTRCAFIKNFYSTNTLDYGELMETKILLGTSIFFNDYRVKTNFPNTQEVLLDICHDIYTNILNNFPNIEIELQSYTLEGENMQDEKNQITGSSLVRKNKTNFTSSDNGDQDGDEDDNFL